MYKRIVTFALCVLLAAALLPSAHLAAKPVLLALGDSVATGYGLADTSLAYPALLADTLGATLDNRAINGQTSGELLAALQSGRYDSALRSASVVVLSIGANDLLRELSSNSAAGGTTGALYREMISRLSGKEADSQAIAKIAARLSKNFSSILAYIAQNFPGMPVIANNIYNPYIGQAFTLGTSTFDLGSFAEAWIAPLNAAFPVSANYILVDIHSVIDSAGLTNADILKGGYDPHPNAAGHRLIADAVMSTVPLTTYLALGCLDVSASDWYRIPAHYTLSRSIFNRSSRFQPDGILTRGGFVRALGRYAGINASDYRGNTGFSDVPATRSDAAYILWASTLGITKGTGNGKFSPDAPVTREQLCVLLYKYLPASNAPSFPDKKTIFTDAKHISAWARTAVAAISSLGLVRGNADGSFDPQGKATRAELATILLRLHNFEARGG